MPNHLFPRDPVPKHFLNTGATPIAPVSGRLNVRSDNLPLGRVGIVVGNQVGERSAHSTTSRDQVRWPWPLLFYPAAATTFFAASVMPVAVVMFSPLSASIFRPCSTLVPSSRTTNGIFGLTSWNAARMAPA